MLFIYRQLFIYLEQREDPGILRTPGADAKLDTGDAALYRQLSSLHISIIEEQDDLDTGDAALYRQLFSLRIISL